MSLSNRIAAARALLDRSRLALDAYENGRRAGLALAGAPGTLPPKPASACDGAARPGIGFQRHGGK